MSSFSWSHVSHLSSNWAISGSESWKSEPSQGKIMWSRETRHLDFELSQDHMHIQTCDIGSFDDFLSYLRVPPVQKYWNAPKSNLFIFGSFPFLKSFTWFFLDRSPYGDSLSLCSKILKFPIFGTIDCGAFRGKSTPLFLKRKWTENQVHRLGAFRRKMQLSSHDKSGYHFIVPHHGMIRFLREFLLK